ncbi:MAG: hypothetical protein ACT4RN_04765 [Pseudonocardia sp.]
MKNIDLAFLALVVGIGVATFVVDDMATTALIAAAGLVVGVVLAVVRFRMERRRRDGSG